MPVRQFAAGRWRAVACVTLYRETDLKPGFALILLPAVGLGLVKALGVAFSGFEGRQVHPIALSRDGGLLFVLNTPGASLSVFDLQDTKGGVPILIEEIPVGLEPVSLAVRDENEVWVVNEVSDSISVVSLRRGAVVATLATPDEPADIVFSGGMSFVSCARSRRVRVFDAVSRQLVAEIPLEGMLPMAMAVGADGGSVYVAFHESGNGTAILPAALAPPPDANGSRRFRSRSDTSSRVRPPRVRRDAVSRPRLPERSSWRCGFPIRSRGEDRCGSPIARGLSRRTANWCWGRCPCPDAARCKPGLRDGTNPPQGSNAPS